MYFQPMQVLVSCNFQVSIHSLLKVEFNLFSHVGRKQEHKHLVEIGGCSSLRPSSVDV